MTETKKRGRPPKPKFVKPELTNEDIERKLARKERALSELARKGVPVHGMPMPNEQQYQKFEPTEEQIKLVYEYALRGVPFQYIMTKIINPSTGLPIEDMTFRKYFDYITKDAKADRIYMIADKIWQSTDTTAIIYLAKMNGLLTQDVIDNLVLARDRLQWEKDKWAQEMALKRELIKTAPPEVTVKWGNENS